MITLPVPVWHADYSGPEDRFTLGVWASNRGEALAAIARRLDSDGYIGRVENLRQVARTSTGVEPGAVLIY